MNRGEGLDEACQRSEILGMRTGRVLALIAMLAVQATCVLGASYASYPNPVGEKAFRPYLLHEMLPVAVIVCALLLGWLLHATQRKASTHPSGDVESHHS